MSRSLAASSEISNSALQVDRALHLFHLLAQGVPVPSRPATRRRWRQHISKVATTA